MAVGFSFDEDRLAFKGENWMFPMAPEGTARIALISVSLDGKGGRICALNGIDNRGDERLIFNRLQLQQKLCVELS
jgi:hypothetical protein